MRPRYDLKLVSLSIVIPAYNEEKRLPTSLDTILEFVNGRYEFVEVIVVDELPRNAMSKVQKAVLRERYKDAFAASDSR